MSLKEEKIWLSSPHIGDTEQYYVKEAFDTNWVAPLGPNVNEFENSIQQYINNNVHVAALSSGTAAIHLALQILGVSLGDEVLCQSFTFSASANPIIYLGATPVFIDSEEDTWNISPILLREAIEDRILKGKKPKAIVAVHLYGMPYKVREINEVAKEFNIPIVEDSAEALGSSFYGVKCGSFGDIGIFSFNGNKIITTSGGGALITKKSNIKEKAVFLATQARDNEPHYEHSSIGFNYRMSNILAGIGRGQMQVLDSRVASRRANYQFYYENLQKFSEIEFLDEPENYFSNRWLSCILTPSFEIREKIRLALLKVNIESRPLWKPMHLQPIFINNPSYTNGTSNTLFERGLCLPSGSNLTKKDLARVVSVIKKQIK
ncbi:DegT/DnrJ/EryC1/StrS family aminotransferase [uncultured Maribacter sp.]|uniref:DegT/DnrJ/EryC1/StrS family aminotransferase n=1 Tax=uncultured Maribacter sp. TaxID=431308 RepID=UPI0026306CC8|nr:DegT/DnrJ/EryC1/StrS family aminotransferase [uncultured Maribacter sp.]